MAWTTPKTWTAEPLTSSDLNTYVRDNQNHIKNRLDNNADYIGDTVSNYTTTSTENVDVDASNLSLTITTNGGDVLVGFVGYCEVTGGNYGSMDINVGGSDYFSNGSSGVIAFQPTLALCSFVVLIEGLSVGSHTFKLRWRVDAGTGTLRRIDGSPQFWVQEI